MMTERSRTAGEELLSTSEVATATAGVLSGLNRINTRWRLSSTNKLSSKPDELAESTSYGAAAASSAKPPVVESKQKNQTAEGGRRRTTPSSKEELRGGKKMVQWLSSYFSQDSIHASFEICSSFEEGTLEAEALDRNYNAGTKSSRIADQLNGKVSSSANPSRKKVPIGLKSYSHELGPKGGIQVQPPPHRAHSYSNLEELLGSLHSRFDATKELVDTELNKFLVDAMDALEKIELSLEEQKMAMDLLLLAQFCIDMACSKFRTKCEMIVQDLTEKRQQCQTGFLKWLFTRMLFILTRCTRLLQFQKDREPLDENSLRDFKKCIESIPSVETSWITNHGIADSGSDYSLYQKGDGKRKFEGQTNTSSLPQEVCGGSIESANQSQEASRKDSVDLEETLPSWKSKKDAEQIQPSRLTNNNFIENSVTNLSCVSNHEQGQSLLDPVHEEERVLDGSDSFICRICEEIVPISHLESHSYICAYADKCDLNCLDIDERLSNLEEILEQIIESRNTDFHPSIESPENSRIQATSSVIADGCSPKISEWRSKGVEGMFEDIHEMDTAYIDDLHTSPVNLKPPLGIKLCNYGGSSSTASVTSASSTNTPRAGQFDSFWLEHNNPSELEDIQQMIDLADIARCVAGTDISKEGSSEFLLACMQDLQDILHHSKLRALVIDTFGGRIEKLLREKYILTCDLIDSKSPRGENKQKELPRLLMDNASQSSAGSTPVHSSHKDRTSIDDFEIIKPISRGAFGRVFLARKRTTGDLFAIKVVKRLDMLRKNDVQRILAERNILITVRNPFVVRFFYSFTCRENLYLVMEYLNGGDLYSLLRNVGYLEEDIARIYMAELVLALEYLHSLGIVHRDLKPDNILIAHDGHIKLTDFGLSKIGLINSTIDLSGPEINGNTSLDALNPHAQQRENSSQHSAVGTPDYLAPEILLGTEHGYASDWWSVGIILFELITGMPPFTADSPEKIFDNILNKKIPWPNVPENMSYEAQDLINRLITHDPQERLGANGSAEVKAHPFFGGVDWDNLALQKAAFVPNPDSADDTSYFLSRFSQMSLGMLNDQKSDDSDSDSSDSSRNSGAEMDEFGELADFGSAPFDLSLMNFSFKNLSQLASINHDVLLQSGKQSPSRAPDKSGSSPI